MITTRKLRPNFQEHMVMVIMNYPILQIFKELDLAERMVLWSIDLAECDIHFLPRGIIKSHMVVDFIVYF